MRARLRPRRRTLLAVVAVGGAITLTRRRTAQARSVGPAAAPSWPPIPPERTATAPGVATDQPAGRATRTGDDPTAPAAGAAPRWVAPADGRCPLDHPVKANDRSGIFHPPTGRSYARTRADRCYADPDAAEADGYRAAKV